MLKEIITKYSSIIVSTESQRRTSDITALPLRVAESQLMKSEKQVES